MKTIVVTSQKGGSGKTTLATHLAVEIERCNDGPVAVVDADPQGSLSTWRSKRQAEGPKAANVGDLSSLPSWLKKAEASGIAFVIVDTSPARHTENDIVIRSADFVLIPTQASPTDLWALAPTIAALSAAAVPFSFVLNRVKPNTRLVAQTAAALSKHGQVMPTFLGDRVDFQAAMIDGRTAPELSASSAAAREISGLWQVVKERISELANLKQEVEKERAHV